MGGARCLQRLSDSGVFAHYCFYFFLLFRKQLVKILAFPFT